MLRGADLALRYLSNRGRPRRRLDRSSVHNRFPSQLKATIGLHGSAPRLQQSAGANATGRAVRARQRATLWGLASVDWTAGVRV